MADPIAQARGRLASESRLIRAAALAELASAAKAQLFDGPDEWLEARSSGEHPIGGSTAPAILGLSPHAGPWDVWVERMAPDAAGGRSIDPADARRGHALEQGILAMAEAELRAGDHPEARVVHIDPALVTHPIHDWIRCSPDGAVVLPGEPARLVEAKSTRTYRDEADWPERVTDWRTRGLPRPDWVVQCCWGLLATGTRRALLLILGPTMTLRMVWVEPGGLLLAELRALATEWRDAHLLWGAEPDREASGACVRWVQQQMATRTYGGHPPARLDAQEAAPIRAWVDAQRAAGEAKSAADAAKPGAVLAMEHHPDGAILPAEGASPPARVVWQTRGKSSFIRGYDHHESEETP